MRRLIPVIAVVAGVLIGCQPQQTVPVEVVAPAPEPETPAQYAERLRVSASELAQSELSRLAAAEFVYRGNAMPQTHLLAMGGSATLFMKIYRNFTGFQVLAIDETNSMLNPISIEIRYDYDLVATKPARTTAESLEDMEYRPIDEFYIRRLYACDSDGHTVEELPPFPPRAEYWAHKSRMAETDRDMTNQETPTEGLATSPFAGGPQGGAPPGRAAGPSFPAGDLPVMPKTPPPGAMDY